MYSSVVCVGWIALGFFVLAMRRRGALIPFALMLGAICHLLWRAVWYLSDIAESQRRIAKASERMVPKVKLTDPF